MKRLTFSRWEEEEGKRKEREKRGGRGEKDEKRVFFFSLFLLLFNPPFSFKKIKEIVENVSPPEDKVPFLITANAIWQKILSDVCVLFVFVFVFVFMFMFMFLFGFMLMFMFVFVFVYVVYLLVGVFILSHLPLLSLSPSLPSSSSSLRTPSHWNATTVFEV